MKKCNVCLISKSKKEFYKNNSRGYLRPNCKLCQRKSNNERRKYKATEYLANGRKKWRADRLTVLKHYGGKCACCDIQIVEFLAVDY